MAALLTTSALPVADLQATRPAASPGGRDRPGAAAAQNETPIFRGSVTLVQIDARVTDAAGNHVSGLTADDFEVLEQREPRSVLSVAEVNIPPSSAGPAPAHETDMASNAAPPGRLFVIALGPVAPERVLRARHVIRDFIDDHLGPYDRASVVLVDRGLSNSGQDFTGNKRLLRAAVDRFSGTFRAEPTDGDLEAALAQPVAATAADSNLTFQLAASLRALVESVGRIPGRKTLLYVAEGLAGLNAHAARDYYDGSLTRAEREFHAAIAAATRGNVTIYPLDPTGATTTGGGDKLELSADLAAIADVTGGFSLTNSNSFTRAFSRIVDESSRFYTIGFSSEYTRLNGRFVSVTVRVKRPGLTVHARNGYVAPLERPRDPAPPKGFRAVAEALESPVPVPDLPMRVVAIPHRGKGADARVTLVVELDVALLELVEKNGRFNTELELRYVAVDGNGKIRPGRRVKTTASLAKSALSRQAIITRALTELSLPPGRYQLRIAAGDEQRAGSVLYDLEIPDFRKEPLTMSGVFMTTASAVAVSTATIGDVNSGSLPGPPVAARDFARQDALALYTEVYGSQRATGPPAVSIEIRRPDGSLVRALGNIRTGPARSGDGDAHGIGVTTTLQDLAPGPYVVHVTASQKSATVRRTIPVRIF